MHPESLDALGKALYGPRYVSQLADALSQHAPQSVQPPHVTMWVKGRRRMPDWVGAAAFRVAERGREELWERAEAVRLILARPFDHGMPSLPPSD